MGIVSITTDVPGQVGGIVGGVVPRRVKLTVTDSYATLTAAGYLGPEILGGFAIFPTDIFDVLYNYVYATNKGTYVELIPSFSNGVITLAAVSVTLPVVSGDLASFSGLTGLLTDSGITAASVAAAAGSAANFTTAVVTMTAAQVDGAYAVPVQIVPAPGAGKALLVLQAQVVTQVSTVFAGGGNARLQYTATINGAGTDALAAVIPSGEITAAASQIYTANGYASATVTTGITNQGLFFSNITGPFTGGAGSTVAIYVAYWTVTATV